MRQLDIKIIENKQIKQGFYRMRVESLYLAKNTRPGQFFEVKCSDTSEPLLRRPLGAHRILKNGVEILYKIVGIGTGLLSKKKKGEYLDAIGPLGNGFFVQRTAYSVQRTGILVAGGIGVAPLVALAEELAHGPQSTVHRKKKKLYVLIGACKKEHILCEKDFRGLGFEVIICTEDGSYGKKGLITEPLRYLLSTIDYRLSTIYACGPATMLETVAKIAGSRNIPCQISLEERMACGVGVCLGCPIKIKAKSEYKMVCKDGPVFNAEEIAW
jgi:dihydroorotate dehydrogenase electron transfer subunit